MAETAIADPYPTNVAPAPKPADKFAAAPTKGNGKTGLADAFREHFAGDTPLTDKVKSFAKAKPWASAALAGIAGFASLGTLKGRGH